mmetsp:Transcript_17921/g.55109  ORF Transcript_17921/g.55109 Transcript_17921/m.55109 type:complete len:267 (+) Transcript_17921:22-822(+)
MSLFPPLLLVVLLRVPRLLGAGLGGRLDARLVRGHLSIFLLDALLADRQLRNELAHLPHERFAARHVLDDGRAVVVPDLDADPARVRGGVARDDLVGLHDVRQLEVLADLGHLLDDGVVAAVLLRDAPPFVERLEAVDVVGPDDGQLARVERAREVPRPRDLRVGIRLRVLGLLLLLRRDLLRVGFFLPRERLALRHLLLSLGGRHRRRTGTRRRADGGPRGPTTRGAVSRPRAAQGSAVRRTTAKTRVPRRDGARRRLHWAWAQC